VESPLESPPEELTRLRATLNELPDIMARPALWVGGAPPSRRSLSTRCLALPAHSTHAPLNVRARLPQPMKPSAEASAIHSWCSRAFRAWLHC
jgi:hypothetical protein